MVEPRRCQSWQSYGSEVTNRVAVYGPWRRSKSFNKARHVLPQLLWVRRRARSQGMPRLKKDFEQYEAVQHLQVDEEQKDRSLSESVSVGQDSSFSAVEPAR